MDALSEVELRTLEGLLGRLAGPGAELPWPLFRFVTEVMATPNIDLLVHDEAQGVLLAWREDGFGRGWHVPGSIIRHREEVAHRIAACAEDELGCAVRCAAGPVAVVQIFDDRGHSLSLCYRATLLGRPTRRVLTRAPDGTAPDGTAPDGTGPAAGDLCWFREAPADWYPSHLVYREVLAALERGRLREGVPLFTQHVGRRDAAAPASPGGLIAADEPLDAA